MECTNCGKPIKPNWQMCPYCELPLSPNLQGIPGQENKLEWDTQHKGPSPPASTNLVKNNIAKNGIIIDSSQQNIQAQVVSDASSPTTSPITKHTEVKDGVVIDKSTINIKHETIYQQITQKLEVPGKYSLTLFPETGSLFPAYRATANGKNQVAKMLGVALPTQELDRFIRQLGLDSLHSGIVRYLATEELQGHVYLMREYCPGQSLAEYKRQEGILEEGNIAGILYDVTKLLLLERKPHGSLKLQNIFIDFRGPKRQRQVSLADFHIHAIKDFVARYDESVAASVQQLQQDDSYATYKGSLLDVAERDAYALGVIALEFLGGNPKEAQSPLKEEKYLDKFGRQIPPDLIKLIERTVCGRTIKTVQVFQYRLIELLD